MLIRQKAIILAILFTNGAINASTQAESTWGNLLTSKFALGAACGASMVATLYFRTKWSGSKAKERSAKIDDEMCYIPAARNSFAQLQKHVENEKEINVAEWTTENDDYKNVSWSDQKRAAFKKALEEYNACKAGSKLCALEYLNELGEANYHRSNKALTKKTRFFGVMTGLSALTASISLYYFLKK
jgi:uncharacterized membrane protein YciS (DUF1049 family)